ncbi:MAG: alpha/beta fold hydrolase, partial [Candidatus Aminicenantales bacterium]
MENALRKNGFFWSVPVLAGLLLLGACGRTGKRVWKGRVETDIAKLKARLSLEREVDPETQTAISRGTFAVFETRNAQKGKMIHLNVVVLHATGPEPRPDPVFFLAGGPGADISQGWKGYRKSWVREDRDIVLVSQRGTGGDNRLDCPKAASDDNLQRYLDPLFDLEIFQDCLEELKSRFDLTQYSTFAAADDLYEVRLALGYDRINLIGGSYGTRMALVYMRQHPETVRTAILNGVAPIAFRNPLYHAPTAQEAIRLILAKCAADPECHAAYPDLEGEFLAVLDRLEKQPAEVMITHPVSKERVTVTLTRAAFAEALRTIMYSSATVRMVP